jgi:hypothetical protein
VVANVTTPPRLSGHGTPVKRGTGTVSRGAATTTRGGASTGAKKTSGIAATPAVPEAPASSETEMDGAAETEPTTGVEEPDLVEQEHPGAGEVEEMVDGYNESAAHDDAPPADDATAEPDTDTLQPHSQTAEDLAGAEEDDQSEQVALPGEKEAEISVPETEAEAAPEHEAEAAPKSTEPEAAMLDEVKPGHSTVSNELESIVNMLQPPFPSSSTHLDVAGEIPDEE